MILKQWNTYLTPGRAGGEIRPKKGKNHVKMRQKSKIKAISVTENGSGGMEDLPDV